ncbi:hypothetical protein OS122_19035 [Mycolicibacterium mucogenicum]|jgi:hypothetical protein|uniref:hypothetical protein n=1 Tax=Mycolicibacterium TaxID=1866885 RepID=UPI00226A26E8|nr:MULTISPECIES: hypothetical protein [Mycolicibacterium]MCX8562993.1 hypothetical protein [Mycolicibacterium mucogenicum]
MHLDWYDRGILTFVLGCAPDAEPPNDASLARFGITTPRVMRRFDAVLDAVRSHQFPLDDADLTLVHQAVDHRDHMPRTG